MDDKIEPVKCCWSGCTHILTKEEENGAWWGPFVYCPKHNVEMQVDLESYMSRSYSDAPDLDDEDIF